jgi:hypothetical protein
MALGVTGSLGAATGRSVGVKTILWSAVGCNLAWGVVDAVMFVLSQVADRGHELRELRRVQMANPEEGRRLLAAAVPDFLANVSTPATPRLEQERLRLVALPESASHTDITRRDLAGALAVFCLVVVSTLPVAVPFLIVSRTTLALRVSQAIGGVLLFWGGYAWGRAASYRPWGLGIAMATLGFAMVGITVALGG